MTDTPVDVLERWQLSGGTWRVTSISDGAAEIDLCTCSGEPVERLRSTDPAFVELAREHEPAPRSRRPTGES